MPKIITPMTSKKVDSLRHPGDTTNSVAIAVGGTPGLHIKINPAGGRSWILRARIGSKRREIGLGPYPKVSLADARASAHEMRGEIALGIDPVEDRRRKLREAQVERNNSRTFAEALKEYLGAGQLDHMRSDKHRAQWVSELERLANPVIGERPVADLTHEDMLAVLTQTHENYATREKGMLWQVSHPSAKKLKQKLGKLMAWATARGYRKGDNPVGEVLAVLLPNVKHHAVSHAAVQIDEAPEWFARVRDGQGMSHRALEFLALTAARSGEVRGATWDEIDQERRLWIIPAERMKMASAHRVPLSDVALTLLQAMPRRLNSRLIFPAPRGGQLSDMTLSATMRHISGFTDKESGRPAVPHGLRSTFKDWATERTEYPNELSEIALAHQVGNEAQRAYRRTDMMEKRRAMMEDWSEHLQSSAEVSQLHG